MYSYFFLNILNAFDYYFKGSTAGGLKLSINGQGFSSSSIVTICNNSCQITDSSFTHIICIVSKSFYYSKIMTYFIK